MAKAYTPGLKVSARTRHRARRLLPVPGEVRVKQGDRVSADTVVAETFTEGDLTPMKLASLLGCTPKELPSLMLKPVGAAVTKDEPIARSKGIFGFGKVEVKAAATGVLESVSDSSGMAIIRGEKLPIRVLAYMPGQVVEVLPAEGVVIENDASLVQGIFGVGGETFGTIALACKSRDEELHEDLITPAMKGAVIVGGARMTATAVRRARDVGAAAVVSGGMDDQDLRDFLGYDLGVAITGSEKTGLTVVITEGFGEISMARRTFALLAAHAGRPASVNGATQIRAGVMRPELVVPLDGLDPSKLSGLEAAKDSGHESGVLEVGTLVRVIRDPHFGVIGTVAALPEQPAVLGSGSKARVLEVAVENAGRITVPRANVELIEG
ncbi:MAG: hypothetical protein KF724_11840 [Phycisphaeraceae bacterium]|nr:hypothetical protein [Phycisphaeraceae bacterium]